MTKLEFANKFFFQWFFVRLTRCTADIEMHFDVMPDWLKGMVQQGPIKTGSKMQWYSIQRLIVPLTGWGDDFKFIGRQWFLRITKKKLIKTS